MRVVRGILLVIIVVSVATWIASHFLYMRATTQRHAGMSVFSGCASIVIVTPDDNPNPIDRGFNSKFRLYYVDETGRAWFAVRRLNANLLTSLSGALSRPRLVVDWVFETRTDGPDLAFRTKRFIIPFWCVLLVTVPPWFFLHRRARRIRRRESEGLCLACGYDLTGNESGVCSECGMTVEAVV